MIVVDANIIVYRVIVGEKTTLARQVERLDSVWVVPLLCKHELANVLLQQMNRNRVSSEEIPSVWADFEAIIGDNEHEVPMSSVVLLAHERGITTYDAQYVWLARKLGTELVTEDKKLRSRCPDETRSMQEHLQSVGG